MTVHFLTFADGSPDLRAAATRLASQAHESGWFKSCAGWHTEDLSNISADWVKKHQDFLLGNRRGYGYWIWKPFMIFERLKMIPMNSFLVAADSGYEISPSGFVRFNQYIEMAAAHDFLGFEIDEKIGEWTKGDLLSYFDVSHQSPLLQDKQIQAGFLIVKKTYSTMLFFSHWAEAAVARNYSLINDAPSTTPNPPGFAEHRHDQAILTLLARMGNFGYFPASEDYHPELFADGKYYAAYPFQCFRNNTGVRRIPAVN